MGGISISIHPLFFLFGLYNALVGKIFIFVIYTATAVIHELGHSFVASSAGYRLNKITLMPYGAVVSGNISGLKFSDEFKIALAGPLINIAVGLFFVATWWIFPESYAFTDVVAEANLSMALVNLLPVFPLDGGRILSSVIAERWGSQKADVCSKAIGGLFAVALLVLFIFTAFNTINVSLLFFSLFVFFGVFGKAKENKYVKLYSILSSERLKRGMVCKKIAIDKSVTIKKLMSLLDETSVNEVVVFDGLDEIITLKQNQISNMIEKAELYSPIEKYISFSSVRL